MKRPWLAPLVPLYAAGATWRARRFTSGREPVRRLGWPVISIGNLSTGGAGKTPFAIALVQLLKARGISVDVLSRGYGRESREPARVDPGGKAEQFGDEPLLIARAAGIPVFVAPQRYDAGLLAESDEAKANHRDDAGPTGPRVHILDDGFQHRQLHRDVDILLLNRAEWSDTLLPAGNLREALHATHRASVVAIPEEDGLLEADLRTWGWQGFVWHIRRSMKIPTLDGPVFAFCGIARSEQFFSGLEASGVRLSGRKAFRDHYGYSAEVVDWLIQKARASGAGNLVTTEKDAARLGQLAALFRPDLPLKTATLSVEIDHEAKVVDWLMDRISPAEPAKHL